MTTAARTTKRELLGLFAEIMDGRVACEACGTEGEWEDLDGRKVCAACHAGCGVTGCGDGYLEARSPIEARLWRLGKHAQAGDTGSALAFHAALANYETAERSKRA